MVESTELPSNALGRIVRIDFYPPPEPFPAECGLMIINDGQDLKKMGFEKILKSFYDSGSRRKTLVAAIYCGDDRVNEYGVASSPDYKGRGARAALYSKFVIEELLPFIYSQYHLTRFNETAYAGFSLGGLSAFDIAWNHPAIFKRIGVFSGSLWWRSKSKDDKNYGQAEYRFAHRMVRNGSFQPGMKFFFQCGEQDESEDRNKNGVIDSIDDAIDLMRELIRKGYLEGRDFRYLQLPGGKHDVDSWSRALPSFLEWGWGRSL